MSLPEMGGHFPAKATDRQFSPRGFELRSGAPGNSEPTMGIDPTITLPAAIADEQQRGVASGIGSAAHETKPSARPVQGPDVLAAGPADTPKAPREANAGNSSTGKLNFTPAFDGIGELMADAARRAESKYGAPSHPVRLDQPEEMAEFGAFGERLDFEQGADLGHQMRRGVRVLAWLARDDGGTYSAMVGPTPPQYDPRNNPDATPLENAGEPGDYLLRAKRFTGGTPTIRHRYLDSEDIDGATIHPGEQVTFAPNVARHRQVNLPGIVNKFNGFR